MSDTQKCSAKVYNPCGREYSCNNQGKFYEDGEWWCWIHVPSKKGNRVNEHITVSEASDNKRLRLEVEALTTRRMEMEAALRPFAHYYRIYAKSWVNEGDEAMLAKVWRPIGGGGEEEAKITVGDLRRTAEATK